MGARLQVVSLREKAACCGRKPESAKRVSRNILYLRSFHFPIGAEGDFNAFGFGDVDQCGLIRYGVTHVPEQGVLPIITCGGRSVGWEFLSGENVKTIRSDNR
jgi:hypothetical protein